MWRWNWCSRWNDWQGNTKLKTARHRNICSWKQVDVTERAGRQAGNRDRVRERRETDRQTERDRWTCRQLDWMESGGQTGRRLPGNQTAGLMICSRHSQCETGRLAHNCSSATADIHPSDKSLPPSLPPSPYIFFWFMSLLCCLLLLSFLNCRTFTALKYLSCYYLNSIEPTWKPWICTPYLLLPIWSTV